MSKNCERSIWPAEPDDVPAILGLVREFAVYEREPDVVEATEADIRAALFLETATGLCTAEISGWEQRLRRWLAGV